MEKLILYNNRFKYNSQSVIIAKLINLSYEIS